MSTANNYNKMAALMLAASLQELSTVDQDHSNADNVDASTPELTEAESDFMVTHQELIGQLTNHQNMADTLEQMDAIDLDSSYAQMLRKWKTQQ